MKKIGLCHLAAIFAIVVADGANAQSNRTFVSGQGADTGSCSIAAPCRSFAYAVTQTNSGGELAVLDTAGYGTVSITQPISIINQDGVEAGIATTSAVDAITVSANGVVNLRGLTLTGGGVGNNGITLTSGGTLNIQNCSVRGFTGNGINLAQAGTSNVNISDTIISNNSNYGIFERPSGSGAVSASLERVQLLGQGTYGLGVDETVASGGSVQVGVSDSLASGNGAGGFLVNGGATLLATVTIVNSRALNNTDYGLIASNSKGTLIISQVTTAGNGQGYAIFAAGVIKTYGNNNITEASNQGSLTPIGVK